MRFQVTSIKNTFARRALVCALFPFLALLGAVMGGVSGWLIAWDGLCKSTGPAWRGERNPEDMKLRGGIIGDSVTIAVPLDLIAYAASESPFIHSMFDHQSPEEWAAGRFRVTDARKFGAACLRELCTERDDRSMIHTAFDDAMEEVVEIGDHVRDGWVWPNAGIKVEVPHEPQRQ